MRRSLRPIIIASRRSALARAQTEMVGRALAAVHPGVAVEYLWIESEGDRIPDASLSTQGGKGLFAKAIEREVLAGRADLAVHSLKDLPAQASSGLTIAAVPMREDPRDCLVAHGGVARIEDIPAQAVLGTASPRRAAQVRRLRPDLTVKLIRGNIETRIRKATEESIGRECDATLLAMAGLIRGGHAQWSVNPIDPAVILPAASQGALALQCRMDDHVTLTRCLPLNHAATAAAVALERLVVAGLEGDCTSPIAAFAEPVDLGMRLRVRVLSPDGAQMIELDESATGRAVSKLGRKAIKQLIEQGARRLLTG